MGVADGCPRSRLPLALSFLLIVCVASHLFWLNIDSGKSLSVDCGCGLAYKIVYIEAAFSSQPFPGNSGRNPGGKEPSGKPIQSISLSICVRSHGQPAFGTTCDENAGQRGETGKMGTVLSDVALRFGSSSRSLGGRRDCRAGRLPCEKLHKFPRVNVKRNT